MKPSILFFQVNKQNRLTEFSRHEIGKETGNIRENFLIVEISLGILEYFLLERDGEEEICKKLRDRRETRETRGAIRVHQTVRSIRKIGHDL